MNAVVEMGQAPIGRLLLKFSLPTIAMMLVNGLYNTIDQIYIGQGMGAVGIAAVTAAFPLMLLSVAIGSLLGAGATTLISISLGAKREAEAGSLLSQAFAVSILAAMVVAALVSLFSASDPQFLTLGAHGLTLFFLGFFSYGVRSVSAQFFQSVGRPAETVVLLLGRNVLLIAGMMILPHWLGLDGVLWAGSASEVLTAAVSVPFLARGLATLAAPGTPLDAAVINRYYPCHAGSGCQAADRGGGEAPSGQVLHRGQ